MKPTTRRLACSFWLGRRPSPSFRPAGLSGRFAAHRSGRAGAQARRLGQLRSVGVFGCVLCLLCFVLCVCNWCAFVCVLAFVCLLCFGCFLVFFLCAHRLGPSFGPGRSRPGGGAWDLIGPGRGPCMFGPRPRGLWPGWACLWLGEAPP